MTNTRVIIHVGLQKTASTFLQEAVFPELDEIAYVGRPYTQENQAFNFLQFADGSLYSDSLLSEEFDRIESDMACGKPIVISDELLSGYVFYNFLNRSTIAERLSRIVPHAEIVLFFRGQADLITSLHNQYVKLGWFHGHLDASFMHPPGQGFPVKSWMEGRRHWDHTRRFFNHRAKFSPEHFRYSVIHDLYSGLFWKVHVFLYEDLLDNPAGVLRRLASICGSDLPDAVAGRVDVVNSRIGSHELRLRLARYRIGRLLPWQPTALVRILAERAARWTRDREPVYRGYVISALRKSGIFEDNHALDRRFGLGMQKYPQQYIDPRA